MRLPAAKLRGHVEHGRSLHLDPGEPPHDLGCQIEQALGEIGPLEEPVRLDVVLVCPAIADVVQMHGELGRIQRPILTKILTRSDDLVPGFEFCHVSAPRWQCQATFGD